MRWIVLVALTLVGCAATAPLQAPRVIEVGVAPASQMANRRAASPREALAEHLARYLAFREAGAEEPSDRRDRGERLKIERRRIFEAVGEAALVRAFDHHCLPAPEHCASALRDETSLLGFAGVLLREHGTEATLELIARAGARDVDLRVPDFSVRVRLAEASAGYASCHPPTDPELAAMRTDLADFLVIDQVGSRLVAREPTPRELDDFAYFMVAVADAGPPVGESGGDDQHRAQCAPQPGSAGARIHEAIEAIAEAKEQGSLRETVVAQRSYLGLLGYPASLDVCRDRRHPGGPGWPPDTMRELAANLEALGEVGEAEVLYRSTSLANGACSCGRHWRWVAQIEGAIRTGERVRGCRRVVPERLLAIDAAHGPQRLVDAGFDLARLYRGALVTRNRDLPRRALDAVLARAPRNRALAALARLETRGTEAWEERVYALEGLADAGRSAALEPLVDVLPILGAAARARALYAIGALAERFIVDPCPVDFLMGRGYGGNYYRREIQPLGGSCDTRLGDVEAEQLSRRLTPWLHDADVEVRSAAASALGRVGSPWSRRELRRIAAHDPVVSGSVSSQNGWRPHYPVRSVAETALENLAEVEARSVLD